MIEPFVRLGIVGIAGHALERHLERKGYPGSVLYVKIATYVVCGLVALVEFNHFFTVLTGMFGIPMPTFLPWQ